MKPETIQNRGCNLPCESSKMLYLWLNIVVGGWRIVVIDSGWKHWYHAQHISCCRAGGEAFEGYVESVLSRFHPDFLDPDSMGSFGDCGCDGIAEGGKVLYACYGQRAVTELDRKTSEKLVSDFSRATDCWDTFTTWRFVTNAKFGPVSTQALLDLQMNHRPGSDRPLTIEVWRTEDLWREVVSKLANEQLNEVMPGVPHAQNVQLADLVELLESLEQVENECVEDLTTIPPVPATKMDFNNLPEATRIEFAEGRVLSPRIDKWFEGQANPGLRDEKAACFRHIYEETRTVTQQESEITERIYCAVGGQDFRLHKSRATAVYAVTAYFFDSCDIFEQPPMGYGGGEVPYATAD